MRSVAAAGVLLAALLVLVAAGGSPASEPGRGGRGSTQPVDPSEVVPASLSRGAIVNWAMADREMQQAADRLSACRRTPRCLQRELAAFTAHSQSALADARMLQVATGSCGQAFASYGAEVTRYGTVAEELAGATHPTPGLTHSLARIRGSLMYAVELVWHSCRRGV